jgi:hypothetical protein
VSTAQQAALDLKAPLASPALTGSPTAPTQTAGDNSTKIATTAFSAAAIAAQAATDSGTYTARSRPTMVDVVTDYAADPTGATDSAAAIRQAIADVHAQGGGIVNVRPGLYRLTSFDSATNALLPIPYKNCSVPTEKPRSVEIRGAAPRTHGYWQSNGNPQPTAGAILYAPAAGSGTNPALIGDAPTGTALTDFNFVTLTLTDLTLRSANNPTLQMVRGSLLDSLEINRVTVDLDVASSAMSQPTNANSVGVIMPYIGNGAYSKIHGLYVFGYYIGMVAYEHTDGDAVMQNCKIGVNINGGSHGVRFGRLQVQWCPTVLRANAAQTITIDDLDIEHNSTTSDWRLPVYDVDDANDYLTGSIAYQVVKQNLGPDTTFLRNSGKKVRIMPKVVPVTRVYQGTTGTPLTSGSWSPLGFDAETVDGEGLHSTSANASRVTITVAGWYDVKGGVGLPNGPNEVAAAIAKNGTRFVTSSRNPTTGDSTQWQLDAGTAFYAAGDYIEMHAVQTSGGPLTSLVNDSWLQVTRVG